MDYSSEIPKYPEHAYSVHEKREARRKLIAKRVKTLLATGVAAATFFGVAKGMESASEAGYNPDSYYNGKVEVVMSDNLYVREAPRVINTDSEPSNTVNWDRVKEINGVKVGESESFVIENPLITEGDDPTSEGARKGSWITLDAKVDNGLTLEDERLYVSLSAATNEYVRPVESGSFIKLDSFTSTNQDLGKVTVNP